MANTVGNSPSGIRFLKKIVKLHYMAVLLDSLGWLESHWLIRVSVQDSQGWQKKLNENFF